MAVYWKGMATQSVYTEKFAPRKILRLSKQKSENKIAVWQQHTYKVTKVIKVPESHLEVISSPLQESQPSALSYLKYAEPTELYLRDGEVVIHCRPRRKTFAAELFKWSYYTYMFLFLMAVPHFL